MIRIDLARTFPVEVGDGFGFITDPANWWTFFPNFIRVHDVARAKWKAPGDRVIVAIRILGREVDVDMTLQEVESNRRVAYISRQDGLPDARHERRFKAVPGGFEFGLTVAFDPRSGLVGLYDRWLVKRAIVGALRKTVDNLERALPRRAAS